MCSLQRPVQRQARTVNMGDSFPHSTDSGGVLLAVGGCSHFSSCDDL